MAIYSLGESIGADTGINQCNVLTIFPMGVQCVVDNPSSIQAVDGSVFLNITGGTPRKFKYLPLTRQDDVT